MPCADGDKECRLNLTLRVGPGAKDFPLRLQGFQRSKRVGPEVRILFNSGDLYLPSEKAMGTDSNKPSILAIRHGAFKDTFMGIKNGHNRTPDGHPVVTYTADGAKTTAATTTEEEAAARRRSMRF